jgi:hypothetical protein
MFGHHSKKYAAAETLRVEFQLEADLGGVERCVHAYLQTPSPNTRDALLVELEQLDAHLADSDAYERHFAGIARYGSGTQGSVIGETSSTPLVNEVSGSEFRAQVALVKAAKDEVRAPTPATFAAVSQAARLLTAIRTQSAQSE